MFENYNKKYMYIGIGIAILLVIIAIIVTYFILKNTSTMVTLTATDNSFSIQIPNNISYQLNNQENNDFVIDLYSKQDEMFFYASRISKERMVDFYEIVKGDKENYLKDKQNIREDSGIIKTRN